MDRLKNNGLGDNRLRLKMHHFPRITLCKKLDSLLRLKTFSAIISRLRKIRITDTLRTELFFYNNTEVLNSDVIHDLF